MIMTKRTKIILWIAVLLIAGMLAVLFSLKYRPDVDFSSAGVTYNSNTAVKPGLRAVFFGTSTLSLTDGINTIMIDGFFSRPSFPRLLTSLAPDVGEIDFALEHAPPKIDAIFVAHSHHDHAMDSGVVAMKTGAVVIGSESTLNIARGQGTPENQLRLLHARAPVEIGQFKITAYETPHSPHPINPGFITKPVQTPAKLADYHMAENFSFYIEHPLGRILIVPSANFTPHTFDDVKANIVILGIGMLGKQTKEFTESYWRETVRQTGAKLVLPVHWDDFTLSLREPLVPMPPFLDNMKVSMSRINGIAEHEGVKVRFLPALKEVVLPVGY